MAATGGSDKSYLRRLGTIVRKVLTENLGKPVISIIRG